MSQVLRITGMHCGGCASRVAEALRALDDAVEVTLEPPQATFSDGVDVSLDEVNALLARIGDYRASPVA